MIAIKRALISCWDKTGIIELARSLRQYDVDIISSGGTARHLQDHRIPVIGVEQLTGFPEVLGGRVKTLHPKIHAAILATPAAEHIADLERIETETIQLVVVNFYPFVEEALHRALPLREAIEYIDIGGPAMLRAAAKNFENVVALFDPGEYENFLSIFIKHDGRIPLQYSQQRSQEAFFYSSWYDQHIHAYFQGMSEPFPRYKSFFLEKSRSLRYGENPHQNAAVYCPYGEFLSGLAEMKQLWGKPLSYNNYLDVHAAYTLVVELPRPGAAIIKHTNPCGAAVGEKDLVEAFEKALRGDPVSAFGGIVACNATVDKTTAEHLSKIFFECIIAPDFAAEALEILEKKKNLRLLVLDPQKIDPNAGELKSLNGIFLLQEADVGVEDQKGWKVVTKKSPAAQEWEDLRFAWKVVKHVKSNAIVLTKNREIYGVGAGQMSRVDSVKIAAMKASRAGRQMKGLVLASDAFFPFRDGIDQAAQAGVTAVIQPGGSIRDEEVIEAANEHQISMIFTGFRHFKH